ncbi:diguanylate cyclase (GGDEF) domain-containing protein [Geodermatophilus obscurus]|uniref:Diguanylate cyclase (GGDEF) domain-containing protein n=1 Tax=Geodermatophilus obscurus TaxID=1861 RepID=A0A1I5H580_9ACTN|nr:GGDEF domain-containing protein [Geodermatophilus obscurus]SFO43468.1 diguanylate cyclase (GGDEF) domain-containing protein [Geodermatophilus obscurus]
MDGDRRGGLGLLALVYGCGAALCAVGALWPMTARTPVALLVVLAVSGAALSAGLWLGRDRLPMAAVHAALALLALLTGLLAWQSVTAVGVVGLGPALVALGVLAGHVLPAAHARAHVAGAVAVVSAGALSAAPSGFLAPWLTAVVTALVLTEAQVRQTGALRRAACTDPLTGLANRRAWEDGADRLLAAAGRSGEPLTVALLDLDGFKAVNDTEGHAAGDALLRALASGWSGELRRSDLLGRLGGDEFALCLPGSDRAATADLLGRLRAVSAGPWSAGTATAHPGETLHEVLARADADLYREKAARPGSRTRVDRPAPGPQGRRQSSEVRCEPAIGPICSIPPSTA